MGLITRHIRYPCRPPLIGLNLRVPGDLAQRLRTRKPLRSKSTRPVDRPKQSSSYVSISNPATYPTVFSRDMSFGSTKRPQTSTGSAEPSNGGE